MAISLICSFERGKGIGGRDGAAMARGAMMAQDKLTVLKAALQRWDIT